MAEEEKVEETTPVESAPTEEQTAEAPQVEETPEPDTSSSDEKEPEKKVSESVPYERFKEVNDKLKALEDRIIPNIQAPVQEAPQLDPESAQAVDAYIERKLTAKRAEEFVNKHRQEIVEDPVLAGTHKRLLEQAAAKGEYLDYEEAFTQAKKLLDERVKPQVKEAKQTGVTEGTELARKRGELGAVGVTGKQPEVDESKLSSEEFAKLHGLQRED
jgi:DNA-binding SARP family transcriptional activator